MRDNEIYYLRRLKLNFLIYLFSICFIYSTIQAQTLREDLWLPNRPLETVTSKNGTIYIGGSFQMVGPKIYGFTVIDADSIEASPLLADLEAAVNAVVADGAGGWYVGGYYFNNSAGLLAHINPDGTLDNWNPEINNPVESLALSDSLLYVGGSFRTIDGQTRERLASFHRESGQLTDWDPLFDNDIVTMAISGSKLYLGGRFTSIDGITRNHLMSFDLDADTLSSWNPDANGEVRKLILVDSTIYVGGDFSNIGGLDRNYLAAIDSATASISDWNPNADRAVFSMAISDSLVYVGGNITNIGGQSRNSLAAININTGIPTSWNPNVNSTVTAIGVSDSLIYIGGYFNQVAGESRAAIAAINAITGSLSSWYPLTNGRPTQFIFNGSKIYIAGLFQTFAAQERNGVAAIDSVSGKITDWNPNVNNEVRSILITDSLIYLGGSFNSVGGEERNNLAAVDISTAELASWNPDANMMIWDLKIDGAEIFVGGNFTQVGGIARNHIAAIDKTTGIVTSWDPDIDGVVTCLGIDNQIVYAGGNFTTVGGQTRNFIVAIDDVSGVPTSWDPNANDQVRALFFADNLLYVGGQFSSIGGQSRSFIAALDTSTGNATSWNPSLNDEIADIDISGTTLYTAGYFSSINGQMRSRVGAIDRITGDVLNWDPNPNNYIRDLEVSGESVYMAGGFSRIGTVLNPYLASISAYEDIAANPLIEFSADSLQFPQTFIGENSDIPVTIYNRGEADLNISLKNIFGSEAPEFSIAQGGDASTIAPGDSEEVVLRFSALIVGSKQGYFVAHSDAASTPDTVHFTAIAEYRNSALSLDGDGDYMEVPYNPALDLTNSLTLSAWIFGNNYEINDLIVHKINAYGISIRDNGELSLTLSQNPDGSSWATFSSNFVPPVDEWYHFAVTYDISAQEVRFYIDGILNNTESYNDVIANSDGALFIGGFGDGQQHQGQIDEVRIWNIARTQSQIQSTMNDTLLAEYYSIVDSGLVANWRFDLLEDLGINGDGPDDISNHSSFHSHGDLFGDATLVPSDAFGNIALEPLIHFSSNQLEFPATLVESTSDLTIMISNTGNADLNINSKIISGDNGSEISVIQGDGSSIIAPNDSEQVVLRFAPTSSGSKNAYFIVESDAVSSPDTVTLSGIAITDTGSTKLSGWNWQNPVPQGNHLQVVQFLDQNVGWAVGWLGTILKTTNGGDSWSMQNSATTENLYSIHFSDANHGWAVGPNGTIVHTSDGGNVWIMQNSGTQNSLHAVYFADDSHGWIIGRYGMILHTTDGGTTWTQQNSGSANWLISVYFPDLNNGWITGESGIVLHTNNGGNTWVIQNSGTNSWLSSVFFINSTHGWLAGSPGIIRTTSDAGVTWTGQASGTSEELRNIQFLNNSEGWIVGNNGTFLKTSDGGNVWTPQNSGTSENLYWINFIDASNGWIVGRNGTILFTSDSGDNWNLQSHGILEYFPAVCFVDNNIGWVAGDNGTILNTINGGTSWNQQISGTSENIRSICFIDENVGFVSGYNGTILKSADGGNNWIALISGSSESIYSLSFIDNNTGWGVGSNGTIFSTTDGGNTWNQQVSGVTSTLRSVTFIDNNSGWISGISGTILHTTNGGGTWFTQSSGTTERLWSIFFSDNQNGWIAGDNGTLLHTANGGISWISQTIATTDYLSALYFINNELGWVVGEAGNIFHTATGGSEWFLQNSRTTNNLEGLFFNDDQNGWVVGNGGVILHTIDGGDTPVIPLLQFSSDILNYPQTSPGSNTDMVLFIQNHGSSNLNISSKTISGINNTEFSVTEGAAASTIAPGDSERVIIQFAPVSLGMKSAEMIISSNAASSPDTIPLVGNNFPEVILPSPIFKEEIGLTIIPPHQFIPDSSLLFYRMAGEREWHSKDLLYDGDEYTAIIDSNYATIRGIEYYIYFTDSDHQILTYPPLNPRENPAIIQVQVGQLATNTILPPEKYKMISIPLELPNGSLEDLFLDDYGEYDKKRWRLLTWDQNEAAYTEYPEFQPSFFPGHACWLITRSGRGFDIEDGLSVASDSPVALAIQPGWNQIGNPFAFTIVWDSVLNSSLLNNPVYWNGDEYEYTHTDIPPWEGYFVFNDSTETVNISFPAHESGLHLQKDSGSLSLEPPEFIVQLLAEELNNGESDLYNYVGMKSGAKDEFDRSDYLRAPAIIKKLELNITDELRSYAGNFKRISDEGARWDLHLSNTKPHTNVRLTFNKISPLPEGFDIWLLNLNKLNSMEIKDDQSRLDVRQADEKIDLRLIIGTEDFAESVSEGIPLQPVRFALFQNYPNPFNPLTVIKYQLEERANVHLEIFNILGQKVRTFERKMQNTGLHQITWDGTNELSEKVGSSIYIYRIQAGSFTETRKMILIR